jgi:hypothetical protein
MLEAERAEQMFAGDEAEDDVDDHHDVDPSAGFDGEMGDGWS